MRGRVLHVDGQQVWLGDGTRLLKSNDGGLTWEMRATLPTVSLREFLGCTRLGRRLGRAGFHHFALTGPNQGVVFAHRHIFGLAPDDPELKRLSPVAGSRPLAVAVGQGLICYGEYRSNHERTPVRVWLADAEMPQTWTPAWRFENVRHVHGVFFDPYVPAFWVTTGDLDEESAIWISQDHFGSLDRVLGGRQQYRAVALVFTQDYIYFGSDAPYQLNYIYRMKRQTGEIETLQQVGGPVFYGCRVGEALFFSTVVEPSKVNSSKFTEVWGSYDGGTWRLVLQFKKDMWPMKYFQYAQTLFPGGPGDGTNLWCTPMATEYDQYTLVKSCKVLLKSSA